MTFAIGRRKQKSVAESFESSTPDVGRKMPVSEFSSAVAKPTVEASRSFLINLVLLAVVFLLVAVIFRMMPLKEVRPWVVEVNGVTGESVLNKDAAKLAGTYKPSQAVLDRELFSFVKALYGLNSDAPALVEESLAIAYATYARDSAINEVREFIERERPYQRMKTIPGLVRTVEKKTITYRSDAPVALLRFTAAERQRGSTAPILRNFVIQITYVSRAAEKQEEIERNPLGLYITHFDIQEERT